MTRLAAAVMGALLASVPAFGGDKRAPRTDLYGDPLPPGAVARLGTVRLRHRGAEVTFSKDGKHLISFGWDGEVRVWDRASGKLVRRKRLKPFGTVALAPGGATAAGWYGSPVRVYDTATGKERNRLPTGHACPLLGFSSDGKLLGVATPGDSGLCIQVWDFARGKIHGVLEGPVNRWPTVIAFRPDSKSLGAIIKREDEGPGGYGEVWLWDVTTGRPIGKKKADKVQGESLAFSPDGKRLAVSGYDGKLHILDPATLEEKAVLRGVGGNQLAFSPDGRLLAGAYQDMIEGYWRLHPLLEHSGVLLWDLKEMKKPRRLPGPGVSARFAFTPDGKTLACHCNGFGSEIRMWDVASGRQLLHRHGHGMPAKALAVSPDGKLVASNAADALYVWKAATGEALHELGGRDDWSHACLFSPDGKRLIAAGSKGILEVWDVTRGKRLQRFKVDPPRNGQVKVHAAATSADGKRLAAVFSGVGTSAQLHTWNLTTGKQLKQRPYQLEVRTRPNDERHHTWIAAHTAFAPDGEVVSVWLGEQVGLENVSTGRLRAVVAKGVGWPMVFSPDGRLLAATLLQEKKDRYRGDDRKGVSLIETATGDEIFRLEIGEFDCLAFTPDGRGLVVADGKSLRVWDTDTGKRLHQRVWPEGIRDAHGKMKVKSLAVLPGGRAVTGMEEGDILVWDLARASWPARKPEGNLGRKELAGLWSDLAGDALRAHRALHMLAAAPAQAVPFLRDHLQAVKAVDAKRVQKLLADLDHKRFAARQAANRELASLRERIEPLLRQTLEGRPSREVRRRLRRILAGPPLLPPETQRTLRAIAALERIDTPEARRLLENLSRSADAPETSAAKAALKRLNRR
jgi:WD40 repeat protein